MLLIMCVFAAVATVGFVLSKKMVGNPESGKLRNRLQQTERADSPVTTQAKSSNPIAPMLQKLSEAAAQPFMPTSREKMSGMRKKLAEAGIYSPGAIKFVTGSKVIFLFGGLLGGYITGTITQNMMLYFPLGGIIGYLAPTMWLRFAIKKNQTALTLGLPDALDLMVVCVEAGLTIDAAMQRVGQELALAHPNLSRELGIAHMEMRVGLSRSECLRNLGMRTQNPPLQSLATMLTQADRFGTSIASALRIHADTLRVKRQHAAEELAAKASVKMSFPLVLFIFPSTFIVLAGPTVIGLMRSSLFQ